LTNLTICSEKRIMKNTGINSTLFTGISMWCFLNSGRSNVWQSSVGLLFIFWYFVRIFNDDSPLLLLLANYKLVRKRLRACRRATNVFPGLFLVSFQYVFKCLCDILWGAKSFQSRKSFLNKYNVAPVKFQTWTELFKSY